MSNLASERTTFRLTESSINGAYYNIESTGTVELLRSSNGDVWKRYSATIRTTINYVAAYASKSASGYAQTCGIINAETWCWGSDNGSGKLGNGTTDDAAVPTQVVRETGVQTGKTDTDIAVGNAFACVVSDARVYCWGSNNFGQLGNNSLTNSSVPVAVNVSGVLSGKVITALAAVPDANTTCALADSVAYCWGSNVSGELGIGSTVSYSAIPRQVTGLLAGKLVTDIALSSQGSGAGSGINAHACAVADGEVYCWGSNLLGMLGNNSTTDSIAPVKVQKNTGGLAGKVVSRVVTGHPHSCALTTDNLLYFWGNNANGQLGNNNPTMTNSTVPVAVYAGTEDGYGLAARTITDITGGGNRSCVIASGTNFCWGLNSQYQIGDGTTTSRFRPTVASYLELRKTPVMY